MISTHVTRSFGALVAIFVLALMSMFSPASAAPNSSPPGSTVYSAYHAVMDQTQVNLSYDQTIESQRQVAIHSDSGVCLTNRDTITCDTNEPAAAYLILTVDRRIYPAPETVSRSIPHTGRNTA